MLLLLFDSENLYNLLLFLITLAAFNYPLIYCVLLLDLVKRSEDLQSTVQSVTTNSLNLIIFLYYGIIGMLIFGVIGYSKF